MKKFFSVMLALVLVLSLSAVAFAASGSPTGIGSSSGTVTSVADAVMAKLDEVASTAAAQTLAADLGVANAGELSLVSVFDFSGNPGQQSLTVAGAAGKRVVLLHCTDVDAGTWEVVFNGTADAGGKISFNVASFSPFAMMVGKAAGSSDSGSSSGADVQAAKTGDPFSAVLMCTLAVSGLTGSAIVIKRTKA